MSDQGSSSSDEDWEQVVLGVRDALVEEGLFDVVQGVEADLAGIDGDGRASRPAARQVAVQLLDGAVRSLRGRASLLSAVRSQAAELELEAVGTSDADGRRLDFLGVSADTELLEQAAQSLAELRDDLSERE